MPYRKLFLSRWSALLWAGGILWTAMDVADFATPAPPRKAAHATTGDADAGDELALLTNAISEE